jgi:hypothetical protein
VTPSHPALVATLSALLLRTLDRDPATPLAGAARLSADVGVTSIDFVAFVEAVEAHYGRPFAFGELLGELAARDEWDITLDGLAAFVARHLDPA